jgi:integrase/recombinase XerC
MLVEKFLESRIIRGVTPKTVAWYGRYLHPWNEFLAGRPEDAALLRAYLSQFSNSQTQAGAYRAIRAFEFWREREFCLVSWFRRCCGWRFAPVPSPPILTVPEFESMMQVIPTTPAGLRDRLALELLFWTGARTGAILGLRAGDVDLTERTLRVSTKGSVCADIAMPVPVADRLRLYIADIRATELTWLFPVHLRNLRRRLVRCKQQVGITKRVWLHGLRHAAATRMLERCHDAAAVQRQLLHSNISTTMKYAKSSIQAAKRAVDA